MTKLENNFRIQHQNPHTYFPDFVNFLNNKVFKPGSSKKFHSNIEKILNKLKNFKAQANSIHDMLKCKTELPFRLFELHRNKENKEILEKSIIGKIEKEKPPFAKMVIDFFFSLFFNYN